ncbi:hypothetical protein HpCOL199_10940 [Helicobacter pylori]
MAKIDSKDSYLEDILKNKLYYQIPIYQRPYNGQKRTAKSF